MISFDISHNLPEEEINNLKNNFDKNYNLPVIALHNSVVFPDIPVPIKLENDIQVSVAEKTSQDNKPVFITTFLYKPIDKIKKSDLFSTGIIGIFSKVLHLPDGSMIGFFMPATRGKLLRLRDAKNGLTGLIEPLPPVINEETNKTPESPIIEREIDELFNDGLAFVSPDDKQRIENMIKDSGKSPVTRIYIQAINSPLNNEEKLNLIGSDTFYELQLRFLSSLKIALERLKLHANITMRTQESLSQQQKEIFLRNQKRIIEEELGEDEDFDDIKYFQEKASKKVWNESASQHFQKELKKLRHYNPTSPDYAVQYSYLDTLLNLPWEEYTHGEVSLTKIQDTLDQQHYGLKEVKDRIIENMAVIKLRNDMKAPILCLAGPPGIGKTSLGKSIAEAIGREYQRISLGGVHDEAEIRGHRRTYIGAMPGRILSALLKCKTGDPVIVLDEIDKIGKDHKGDPSTALLELLDPEQNFAFHDNYIDFDYDLSKVLFITTANNLQDISRPLLDRMEIIEMSGYTPEEKREIGIRHLIKKSLNENGLADRGISFSPEAISYIIDHYTRESGVRQLEKQISKILRKIATLIASDKDYPKEITVKEVKDFLGKEKLNPSVYENNNYAGVATGLAWTSMGGDILFIETSLSKGSAEKLVLTGNLGDVMKESATLALQYVKTKATELDIPYEKFDKTTVHIHVPEGAIPKDGPSAGVTMTVSIASAFTGRKVRDKLAMTGEITLRGKILPVGGIKEKMLAAKRAGITDVILPSANQKDIEEINPEYLEGLTFHYFDNLEEALSYALLNEKAEHCINLN